jgi:hypothetical protein
MKRENFLVGSFGKNIVCDDYSEYSFYKNLPEVIVEQNGDVIDFDVTNDNVEKANIKNTTSADFTKLFERKENTTNNIIQDVLFSGYFGQKTEEDGFNGNFRNNKNGKSTNPFPKIEEERSFINNCASFDSINRFGVKKHRLSQSFNQCLKSVDLGSSFKKKSNYR